MVKNTKIPKRLKPVLFTLAFLILVLITGCAKANIQTIPHASIKVIISPGKNQRQIFNELEKVILSLGYTKQPDENFLIIYKKDKFEIMYDSQDEAQSLLGVVYVHFYEQDNVIFSDLGITEYESVLVSFNSIGLKTGEEDKTDVEHSRHVTTPQMFNQLHPPPTSKDIVKSVLPGLVSLLIYGLIVFLPAFLVGLKLINSVKITTNLKRILFVSGSALFLAPIPVPLTMWGPFVLVPLPLCAPLALLYPVQLMLISTGGTAILASIVSLYIHDSFSSK